MAAFNKDTGRSVARERKEEMADRGRKPAARFTVKNCDPRTAKQRRAALDTEAMLLNVPRMCFI